METRDKVVDENIGLVHACAKRFKGRGIEYDDLFQAGCLGLVKAIDAFDKDRGVKLSTYAVPVILGEIKRLFRDGGAIKVGRSLKELSLKASRTCREFQLINGREPTISELSKILGVETSQAAQALNASIMPMSLTQQDEDGEFQVDIPIEFPEEKISDRLSLKQSISELDKEEQVLIILRFFKMRSQTETGKVLGMTQVQVSRKEKKILKKLREKLK